MALHHMLRAAAGNSAGPSDPYFYDVTLLLTGDGTNGAQNNTFLDSSTNNFTITRNGNTTQGTFSPYGNLWSNYFDGSGDYLATPSNSAFAYGTGDWTAEAWIYPTSTLASMRIFEYGGNADNLDMNVGATGKISYYNGSTSTTSSTAPINLNAWNHIACVRSSGTISVYVNGVSALTQSSTPNTTTARVLNIGGVTNNLFNGYISNLRVVKGTALYTSNFTPSTTPLTAVSGTSLLTCQSNRFIDNSSNNFTLTVNGNTSVQRFSPFNPTAPYSTATIGGSGYFDGSGDYLQAPSNAAFNFGTGEFTVEAWVYLNTLNTDKSIIDFRSTTNSFGAFYISGSGNVLGFYDGSVTASGTALVAGAWYHIAYVRTGTTLYAYLNGVQQWTRALSTNITSTGAPEIGADFGGSASLMNGYISNLRVVKGTAVYTTNFTPPTTPLTAITNTSLLCNFTNAGIPDAAMMNDLETVGNAQVSTSVKKYGTGSLYFDGSGDGLFMPYTSNLELKNTYTIEAWIYPLATSGWRPIFTIEATYASSFGILNLTQNGTSIEAAVRPSTGGAVTTIVAGTVSSNTWYHVALSVNATSARLFLNGTQIGSTTTFPDYTFTPIGAAVGFNANGFNSSTEVFNGYIDDLRITKGYARYTANFTPPTAALPTY